MGWEWKIDGQEIPKTLTSRPTLDVAENTPGPRFDEELALPLQEISLRAEGVPADDPDMDELRTAAAGRAVVVSVTDKLGRTHTGKLTRWSETNYDGTGLFEVRITIRKEQA